MKKMSNVIFLNIDGILNYTKWYTDERNPGNLYGQEGELDPLCIHKVNAISKTTNAAIVISSDWRLNWNNCLTRLQKAGLFNVIGPTPMCSSEEPRGIEIEKWLELHPEFDNYVIIDDRQDFTEEQLKRLVHVDPMYGLTDKHVGMAIKILNKANRVKEILKFFSELKPFTNEDNIPDLPVIDRKSWNEVIIPNLIRCGAIPKDNLIVGHTYIGSCRNSNIAVWNGEKFDYKRWKFGSWSDANINHFEDDDGYDLFVPIKDVWMAE